MKIAEYTKEALYSYTIGVYPTIELLTKKPKSVTKVLLKASGTKNSGVDILKSQCEELNIPVIYDDRAVDKLSKSENCYALGIFNKYTSNINKTIPHLVLVQPSDMGNLGTIIRTMLAFNITELAIIKPAVDIFNPKVLRSSMGTLFSVNFEYFDSFTSYVNKQDSNRKYYLFATDAKKKFNEVKYPKCYSLVFGNEGSGLSADVEKYGTPLLIPQSNLVDSLNLSVAVGIALQATY